MTVKENEKDIMANTKSIALLTEMIGKISRFLFGNGGTDIGLDETVREILRRLGSVESNTKEALTLARERSGITGVVFDDNNHPGRRESDKGKPWLQRAWEKTTENLFDKFVTAIIIIIILNTPDIIEKFVSLAK